MAARHPDPVAPRTPSHWPFIVFLGPFVGSLVVIAWLMVSMPPATSDAPWYVRLVGAIQLFGMGWVIGFLPAALAAFWWHRIERAWPDSPARLLLGAVIGAISAVVWLWPIMLLWWLVLPMFAPTFDFYIAVAVAGALAMVVTVPRWRAAKTISGARR